MIGASVRGEVLRWLVPLLVCPVCGGPLEYVPDQADDAQGLLRHAGAGCDEAYPVVDGIPRMLVGAYRQDFVRARARWFERDAPGRELAARWRRSGPTGARDPLVAGFDFEWTRFATVGTPELREIFDRYFDLVPASAFAADRVVLDAGCGAGRWAYEVARRGPRVIAVELGTSVELAHRNTRHLGRVACVQADIRALPVAPRAVDWAYAVGVLHHFAETQPALARIVEAVRPGGLVLVYVYYALDNRGRGYRSLFAIVDAVRRVTSRLPRTLVMACAYLAAAAVYWPLARLSRLLARVGLHDLGRSLPLAFYRDCSFQMMVNDSLDRFGTRFERRYTRRSVVELMHVAGLSDVRLSPNPPYWHAVGEHRG